jgi:transposase-like protein
MLGFGPPANRQARQEWWRRQIQRQSEGNLSVAEFCRRRGVSAVTFYYWKRRHRETVTAPPRNSEKAAPTRSTATPAAFLPVSVFDTSSARQLEVTLANAWTEKMYR